MNKELILKYKAEFDHSLYGGKLQVKFVNDPWEEAPEDIFSYSTVNFVLVIDDAYVEFRKALAEGKVIQLNEAEKFSDQNRGWVDLSCTSLGSSTNLFPVEYYRIKPEKPKFKVGDWVIHNGEYKQVTKAIDGYIDSLDNEVAVIMKEESLELWEPKLSEWCWYSKWDKIVCVEFYLCKFILDMKEVEPEFKHRYEPFIGQLPTFLES